MPRNALYYEEAAYARSMEAVAMGTTRQQAYDYLVQNFLPWLDDVDKTLNDALDGALSCGIEKEDIDPSWL